MSTFFRLTLAWPPCPSLNLVSTLVSLTFHHCTKVVFLCPLCPVVSVSLPLVMFGGCSGFVIWLQHGFRQCHCSSFFSVQICQVNHGTTVRKTTLLVIWAVTLMLSVYWKIWAFKVQCPEFPWDALIHSLCLNLSEKMEEQLRFFMVHLQSFVLSLPSFLLFTMSI